MPCAALLAPCAFFFWRVKKGTTLRSRALASFRATTTSDNAGPTSAKTPVNNTLDPLASPYLAEGGTSKQGK